MGYDYKTGSTAQVGSVAPLGGPIYDIGDTIRAYVGRIPASRVILGVPYYGRAWSTDTSPARGEEHLGDQVRCLDDRRLRHRAAATPRTTAASYDPVEGVAWTVYMRQNCTAHVWLRQPVARDLLRRRDRARGQVRPGQPLRPARRGLWALGYDGTRTELYSLLKTKFITDTVPPAITSPR